MDFKKLIVEELKSQFALNDITDSFIEIPPDGKLGDFALPCFRLSKQLRKSPLVISEELAKKFIKPNYIKSVTSINGYLNFFLDQNIYAKLVLDEILSNDEIFESKDQTVLVEFSSPNIAKPFHIGHLCSTIIGDSLSKIYKLLGYRVVRINYLGDYGTQFGKLISAFKRWGNSDELEKDPIDELFRLYVKFHHECATMPELEKEGQWYFKRLEDGDLEEKELWLKFKELSLKKFNEIYQRLQVSFDSFEGESFFSDKMDSTIDKLKALHLLTENQGAQIVDLSDKNMPPCIILKSDGASIYATRDLTAAIYRYTKYSFVKSLYVVGLPQELHFKQVFEVLNKMGYTWSKDCIHVGFAHVTFEKGSMSTRKGKVVFLEDVLDESVRRIKQKMNESSTPPKNVNEVAESVGVGAVKYAFLKSGREREITFSWDETLDFNGDSGPYVQYTYSRARSILRKANRNSKVEHYCINKDEFELLKILGSFRNTVLEAAERNEPSVITRYVGAVSRVFNHFYNACSVIGSDYEEQRLCIVEASCKIISTCLNLIGLESLEEM